MMYIAKYKFISLSFFICLFLNTQLILADGIIFNEVGTSTEQSEYIGESSQRTFIYFDPQSQQTRIIFDVRTISFQGEFAWVIPLPYIPQDPNFPVATVEEVSGNIEGFNLLSQMTAPKLTIVKHLVSIGEHSAGRMSGGCRSVYILPPPDGGIDIEEVNWSVQVWSESLTENFYFTQISAINAFDLYNWLYFNGFGEIPYEDLSIFQDYCDRGFSFLIITGVESQDVNHPSCISVTFPSTEPFFPLNISALGAEPYIDLTLYVCAPYPFIPIGGVNPFRAELEFPSWYLFNESEVPGEYFNQELNRALYERGLSLNNPLPTDWYWQDCSLTLFFDEDHPFKDPTQFPFFSGLAIPDSLWIGRFHRAFYDTSDLQDVYFKSISQEDFRGEITVYVDVLVEDENKSANNRIDLSFIFLVLFFPCMLSKKFFKKNKKI